MTPRATEMADGCLALAAHASRVLDLPHTVVELDQSTSPREGGVSNRAVLTGPNLEAQTAVTAASSSPPSGSCASASAPAWPSPGTTPTPT